VAAGRRRRSPRPGVRTWLATRLPEAATWQELAFAVLAAVVLWPLELFVVTIAVLVPGLTIFAPLLVAIAPTDAVPNASQSAERPSRVLAGAGGSAVGS
jgi:hypothetical protein